MSSLFNGSLEIREFIRLRVSLFYQLTTGRMNSLAIWITTDVDVYWPFR